MRIREGDPLEIYTDRDGEVIFKKYSPIGELEILDSIRGNAFKNIRRPVLITDKDNIIAVSGVPKRFFRKENFKRN